MVDNKKDNSSWFSRMAVMAPIAGTLGYALYNQPWNVVPSSRGPVITDISSIARNAVQLAPMDYRGAYSKFFKKYGSDFASEEGSALVREAYMHTLGKAEDLTGPMARIGNIAEITSPDLANTMSNAFQMESSRVAYREFKKFKSTYLSLRKQQQLRGKVGLKAAGDIFASTDTVSSIVDMPHLPIDAAERLQRIQKQLAADISITSAARPDGLSTGGNSYFVTLQTNKMKFGFSLPIAQGGVLTEGPLGTTRRIAPDVALANAQGGITSKMSRHAYLLEEIEKSLIPDIVSGRLSTDYEVKDAVNAIYQDVIQKLEPMPIVPDGIKASIKQRRYEAIRGQAVDVRIFDPNVKLREGFTSRFRTPSEIERSRILSNSGLIASTSPQNIAASRLSTHDPRGWFLTPKVVDLSRRPTQALRTWAPSDRAEMATLKSNRAIFGAFETPEWKAEMGPNAGPHLKALYLDPKRHDRLMSKLRMGEGEFLVLADETVNSQMEMSRVRPNYYLSSIEQGLEDRIRNKDAFQAGELLGVQTSGKPLYYKPGMDLLSLVSQSSKSRGNYFALSTMETRQLRGAEKFFGQVKGLGRFIRSPKFMDRFDKFIREGTRNPVLSEGLNAVISMDELRKNRALHNHQMMSAMFEVLGNRNASTGFGRSLKKSPVKLARFLEKQAMQGDVYKHEMFVEQLMNIARQEKFTPHEFGAVFGAVPAVLGSDVARQLVPENDLWKKVNFGMVIGDVQPMYGGPAKLTGAGAVGSIEPRVFELLHTGQYGGLGESIANELADRIGRSGKGVAANTELLKTLQSVAGKVQPGVEDRIFTAGTDKDFGKFIDEGGGWLRIGKGYSDVYLPGAEKVDLMSPYTTASGQIVQGNLRRTYSNLAQAAERLYSTSKGLTPSQFNERFSRFTKEIGRQQAPAGRGVGSILRGRLPGSRFMTGVTSMPGVAPIDNPFQVGLPENMYEKTLRDMERLYGSETARMIQAEVETKGTVPGLLMRHPFTSAYSVLPTEFKILKGVKSDKMIIPSIFASLRFAGEQEANPINLSPAVGMLGDFDADIYAAALVSPKLGKQIRQEFLQDSEYSRRYVENMIRMQLIKVKAANAGEEISTIQKMAAEGMKLGTTQEWVPKISLQLSDVRRAIGTQLKGNEAADAMFLATMLEQIPVAGKQLSAKDVLSRRMSSSLATIESAIRERNEERLLGATQDLFRKTGSVGKALLEGQDIQITEGLADLRQATGIQGMEGNIRGLSLPKTVNSIMSALNRADTAGTTEAGKLLAGRTPTTRENITQLLELQTSHGSQSMGLFSKAVLTGRNIVAQTGEALIKHHRKIGFGFAGSIALAAMLASPKDTIGPGSAQLNDVKVDMMSRKAHKTTTPENIIPPGREGIPEPPSVVNSGKSYIMPGGTSVRAEVHGRTTRHFPISNLARGAQSGSVNVNIRDDRSKLDEISLSKRLLG